MGLVVIKNKDYEVICDGKVVIISWGSRVKTFKLGIPETEIEKHLSALPEDVAVAARKAIKEATETG